MKLKPFGLRNGIEVVFPQYMRLREDPKHMLMGTNGVPTEVHTVLKLSYALYGYNFYITMLIVTGLEDKKLVITSDGDHDGISKTDFDETIKDHDGGYTAILFKNHKGKLVPNGYKEAKIICDKKNIIDSY